MNYSENQILQKIDYTKHVDQVFNGDNFVLFNKQFCGKRVVVNDGALFPSTDPDFLSRVERLSEVAVTFFSRANDGIVLLAEFLKTNTSINRLTIDGPLIDDVAAVVLADALKINTKIEYLCLEGNITDAGAEAFQKALETTKTEKERIVELRNSFASQKKVGKKKSENLTQKNIKVPKEKSVADVGSEIKEAIKEENFKKINEMLEKKVASVNAVYDCKEQEKQIKATPLGLALCYKSSKMIDFLVGHGADLKILCYADGKSSFTALGMVSSYSELTSLFKLLKVNFFSFFFNHLKAGADVNDYCIFKHNLPTSEENASERISGERGKKGKLKQNSHKNQKENPSRVNSDQVCKASKNIQSLATLILTKFRAKIQVLIRLSLKITILHNQPCLEGKLF